MSPETFDKVRKSLQVRAKSLRKASFTHASTDLCDLERTKGRKMQVPNIRIVDMPCEELLVALLENFMSNFEEARRDRVFQQLMISAPPVSTGSVLADALIAAMAEHLATMYRLRVPSWVHDEWRSGPSNPSTIASLRVHAVAGSPSFSTRNIAGVWPGRLPAESVMLLQSAG
jgi:hypothetical protein